MTGKSFSAVFRKDKIGEIEGFGDLFRDKKAGNTKASGLFD